MRLHIEQTDRLQDDRQFLGCVKQLHGRQGPLIFWVVSNKTAWVPGTSVATCVAAWQLCYTRI